MNTFTSPLKNTTTLARGSNATTMNGAPTLPSSGKPVVDLFFLTGAARGQNIIPTFVEAFYDNKELALRTMLYARDIREGQGERQVFRDVLVWLEKNDIKALRAVLPRVADLGRWDDLLVLTGEGRTLAFSLIREALAAGNGLCAKWMPRKGDVARELRNFLGLSPKNYRKTLVRLSNTVEQLMCANNWSEVNYDHIPSVASARYRKAFFKHDGERYKAYVDQLVKQLAPDYKPAPDEKVRKINAAAIFPHDIIRSIGVSEYNPPTVKTADYNSIIAQWAALPDWVGQGSFLPLIDVSGSMYNFNFYGQATKQLKTQVRPIDVAVALGLYVSERNKSAFKDMVLTFESNPKISHLTGNVIERANKMAKLPWGGSTNLEAAYTAILNHANKHKVLAEDMPKSLIIISDMEFNSASKSPSATAFVAMRQAFEASGYDMPTVIWWNVNGREGNSPVTYTSTGTGLVSGFSPSIMKNLLSSKTLTPLDLVLDTIMKERYVLSERVTD